MTSSTVSLLPWKADMAFCIPVDATAVPAHNSVSEGACGRSRCRCDRYRERVRRFRGAAIRGIVRRVEGAIARHEAEVRSVLNGSLDTFVREAAVAIVKQVFDAVPEVVAQGLAERAAEVASTVLQGERGVVALVHPRDYPIIAEYLGGASLWQWRADEQCPRGEIHIHLSAGRITMRWRDLLEEILGREANNDD